MRRNKLRLKIAAVCLLIILCVAGPLAIAVGNGNTTVYITETGECYHRGSCSYLYSKIETTLQEAVDDGYRACSRCKPPKLEAAAATRRPTATASAASAITGQKTDASSVSGDRFPWLVALGGLVAAWFIVPEVWKEHKKKTAAKRETPAPPVQVPKPEPALQPAPGPVQPPYWLDLEGIGRVAAWDPEQLDRLVEAVRRDAPRMREAAEDAPEGQLRVFWSRGGKSYHLDGKCSAILRSKVVYCGTIDEAKAAGKNVPCSVCGRGAANEFSAGAGKKH